MSSRIVSLPNLIKFNIRIDISLPMVLRKKKQDGTTPTFGALARFTLTTWFSVLEKFKLGTMVKDRLPELREKSVLKDEEFELDQKYEKTTLHNQKQILSDLNYFGEIFSLINDLRRNIREIETQIGEHESFKDDGKMAENANLCFRIFTAVKGLKAEMDKHGNENPEVDELVSEVRRVQFEGVQRAYIEAYWEYDAIVRRYEEEVKADAASRTVSLEVINEHSTAIQQDEDEHQDDQHDETSKLQIQTTAEESIEQAEEVLDQLVDRSQELAALEESLLTMRNLFVLFSTLVMEHGSILNLVEGNVQVASEHVAAAVVELKEARKYYRRTQSCRCWCIDVMTILMAILGLLTAILCWMIVKKFLFKTS